MRQYKLDNSVAGWLGELVYTFLEEGGFHYAAGSSAPIQQGSVGRLLRRSLTARLLPHVVAGSSGPGAGAA